MSKKTREIAEYYLELCNHLDDLRLRAMFGGHGLYSGDAMFGLEACGELFFKCDDENIAHFEAVEAHPFLFISNDGKQTKMSYHSPPADILGDPEQLVPLLQSSYEAALRALTQRNKKAKKSKKTGKKMGEGVRQSDRG